MAVDGFVAACCLCQGLQLSGQHVAHADRILFYQFREHLAERSRQVVAVLLHLSHHMLTGQQGIESSIGRGVDIGRQVRRQVVDGFRQQVFVELAEDVLDQRRVLLQRIDKGIAHPNKCRELHALRILTTVRFLLEQQKHLILDFQVGEG